MKKKLLFVYPLIYRPDKENVGKFFALLSEWYEGYIFAMSGERQRALPVADFLFYSERYQHSAFKKIYWWLRFQVLKPMVMLQAKAGINAVISYDPYKSGLAAYVLGKFLRCKVIVQFNGDYHKDASGDPGSSVIKKFIQRQILHFVLRGANGIKVLNADQEEFCRRVAPKARIFRFPSFVATQYFQSLESRQGDYILSVGYPFHLKGMDVLIAAFLSIADKHQHASLRIMGYCSPEEKAEFVGLTGGDPRISFIPPGWIEDVGEQMRGCYAYVNAARSEAMGRSQVEAMACAKPIVATLTNGAKVCIADGITGFLCEIGNVEALAAKLDQLLEDRELAARMGSAGKERMLEVFSEAACAEAFHRMIEEVLENNATSN